MFCLASVVSYLGFRLSEGRKSRYALYALSIVFVLAAMKTKEISFTFPLVIAAAEFIFFKERASRRAAVLLPVLLTMLVIPLSVIDFSKPIGTALNEATRTQEGIPRLHYLVTQPRAVVTYLRLLVLPINQTLDYDYPIYRSLSSTPAFLSIIFIVLIAALSVYLATRKGPRLRLAGFGLMWFFLTLSVESSAITLADPIFEHRLYLPSIGFILSATVFVLMAASPLTDAKRRYLWCLCLAVPLTLALASWSRNNVWATEVTLWEDVVTKSPMKEGPHINLGDAYESIGLIDKAIEQYRMAIHIKPDNAGTYNDLGNAYKMKGLIDMAIENYKMALMIKKDYSQAYSNLGIAYSMKGLGDKAVENYIIALRWDPYNLDASFNLGIAYLDMGFLDKAQREFEKILRIDPKHYNARQFLNYTLKQKKQSY